MISQKTTSIKFLEMDDEELFNIFDSYTDILIDDKTEAIEQDSSVFDFMEATVREMATGEEIFLSGVNKNILNVIENFMNHFHIYLDTKSYKFVFGNCIAEGNYINFKQNKEK
jgi:hypothetical protein